MLSTAVNANILVRFNMFQSFLESYTEGDKTEAVRSFWLAVMHRCFVREVFFSRHCVESSFRVSLMLLCARIGFGRRKRYRSNPQIYSAMFAW